MVPISVLLQVAALTIGDETELRRVQSADGVDLEAESRPVVGFTLSYPKATLGAVYAPTLFAGPLESKDRRFETLHAVLADASKTFSSRRNALTLSLNGSGEQRNPRREVLATLRGSDAGTGGGGAPGAGGAGTPGAPTTPTTGDTGTTGTDAGARLGMDAIVPGTVRTARARGSVRLQHVLAPTAGLSVEGGYVVSGGVDGPSRDSYPLIHGPNVGIGLSNALSRRDSLASNLSGSLSISDRNRAWLVGETETLSHTFTRTTSGSLGAGVSYFRNEAPDGEVERGVTPTASAALSSVVQTGKGKLDSRLTAEYTPVLDPQTAKLDPRIRTIVSLVWTREALALSLRSDGVLSGTPGGADEVQGIRAEGVVGYDLGSGFAASAGARGVWQRARGVETLPPSSVLFVALAWSTTIESK